MQQLFNDVYMPEREVGGRLCNSCTREAATLRFLWIQAAQAATDRGECLTTPAVPVSGKRGEVAFRTEHSELPDPGGYAGRCTVALR